MASLLGFIECQNLLGVKVCHRLAELSKLALAALHSTLFPLSAHISFSLGRSAVDTLRSSPVFLIQSNARIRPPHNRHRQDNPFTTPIRRRVAQLLWLASVLN